MPPLRARALGLAGGMPVPARAACRCTCAPPLLTLRAARRACPPAGVWKASAALLGDVASTLSAVGVLFQHKAYVQPFLQQLAQDSPTADTANWASQMIQKALRS